MHASVYSRLCERDVREGEINDISSKGDKPVASKALSIAPSLNEAS
jgi:hypothetical protein